MQRRPPRNPQPLSGTNTHSQRLGGFDALRGLAALVVVSAHALAAFLPWAVFGRPELPRHADFEAAFHFFPFSLLTAGHFAVCLFFVLSGYILSQRFIGEPQVWPDLIAAAVKRPIRLGGLVLASLLLAGLLWYGGGFSHLPVAEATGSVGWLGTYWVRPFDLQGFLHDLVLLRSGNEYNPPLWTIRIEFFGSFLVFGVVLILNWVPFRLRAAALVALSIGLHGSFYQGFVLGILLADCQRQGLLTRARASLQGVRFVRLVAWVGAGLAVFLASFPYYSRPSISLAALHPLLGDLSIGTGQWATPGAALLMLAFLLSPSLQRLIDRRWLHRLGDWSFAIYVLHFLVLGSVVCTLFLFLHTRVGYLPAVLIANLIGLLVLMPLAALATRVIDQPAIALANQVGTRIKQTLRRCSMPVLSMPLLASERLASRGVRGWRRRRAVQPVLLVPGWGLDEPAGTDAPVSTGASSLSAAQGRQPAQPAAAPFGSSGPH